jgi:hypothetical protein
MLFVVSFAAIMFRVDRADANPGPGDVSVVYLLDVSGSMNRNGLFAKIKQRLADLVLERQPGDRVVLITFGEDVWKVVDVEIRDLSDLKEIMQIIERLQANSKWTWMSKALEKTRSVAEDLRQKAGQNPILIYLLTDCSNDPPPKVKLTEPPWNFVEVLIKYFKDFQVKGSYVYLISYRPLQQDEKNIISDATQIEIREPSAGQSLPARVIIRANGLQLGEIDLSHGSVERMAEILVERIEGTAAAEIKFKGSGDISVSPWSFHCTARGQKENVKLIIEPQVSPGAYEQTVQVSSPDAIVEPPAILVSFTVKPIGGGENDSIAQPQASIPDKPPNKKDLFYLLLSGLLALVALSWLLYKNFRSSYRRLIWIEDLDMGGVYKVLVQSPHRLWLGENQSPKHIKMGIPNYYLAFDRKGNLLLFKENNDEGKLLRFDSEMSLESENGRIRKLRFQESDPQKIVEKIESNEEGKTIGVLEEI